MISMRFPDNAFVPLDRILSATRGVNKWLFFKASKPFDLLSADGKKQG